MKWFLLILTFGILGFLWYRYKSDADSGRGGPYGASGAPRPLPQKLPSAVYRAVELQPCTKPCEVALAIAGKRFLAGEAPALPLPGCKRSRCRCSYKKYDDRRAGQRRDTSLYSVSVSKARPEGDRRAGRGRRYGDRPRRDM
jgi:hypothetical protein